MNEISSAAAILSLLEAEASPARKLALARLKAACDDLASFGPIKLAAIEKHVRRNAGNDIGPRAQSISNERSRPLGMYHYVVARNRERAPQVCRRSGREKKNDLNQVIDRITDIDVQSEMRDLYDRMQVAEANFARSKHLLKTMRPGLDVSALIANKISLDASDELERTSTDLLLRLGGILTDDRALGDCGLCFDNGVVKRRVGTRDILIGRELMTELLNACQRIRQIAAQ